MLAIIDYGIGNVKSVQNAFEYLAIPVILTRDPKEIANADGLVLPGVGAFAEGMRCIEAHRLHSVLDNEIQSGKPILGICLGFQMLMKSSNEQGINEGLGFLSMDVIRLPVDARLPHIGWSKVQTPEASQPSKLMKGLEGEFFYFVHSYGILQCNQILQSASAFYGGRELMALVEHENVFGTQFHPEKSGEAGLTLLNNFAELAK